MRLRILRVDKVRKLCNSLIYNQIYNFLYTNSEKQMLLLKILFEHRGYDNWIFEINCENVSCLLVRLLFAYCLPIVSLTLIFSLRQSVSEH